MISYNYFPEKKFILTVLYCNVTPLELHELIDKLQTIKPEEGGMRGLVVLCKNAKNQGVNAKHIMSIGERMHNVSFRKSGKNAIIAKSLLAYGLSRMYKVASDVFNLDVLKIYKEEGLNEAINWLGISDMKEEIYTIINHCELTNCLPSQDKTQKIN